MIQTKQYYGTVGLWYLIDPALTNAQILRVSRNDRVHSLTGEEAVENLEYAYSSGVGSIVFDPNNPFVSTGPTINDLEKIKVKYKT